MYYETDGEVEVKYVETVPRSASVLIILFLCVPGVTLLALCDMLI